MRACLPHHEDDNGTPIRVLREFKVKLTESGNSMNVTQLRLLMKRGVSTTTETTPEVLIKWRFDEIAEDTEWITEQVDLGIGTDTKPYIDLQSSIGTGSILHIQLIETDAVRYLLHGIKLTGQENAF